MTPKTEKTGLNVFLTALFLGAGTLAVFAQVTLHDFVFYGDPLTLLSNPFIRPGLNLEGLRWAFLRSFGASWIPLTWVSHMLAVSVFGLNPAGHHAVNLVLHCASVIFLFLAFNRLTNAPGKSAVLAALFAVHPLQVEAVSWITARKDLLASFFMILSLWFYSNYAEKKRLRDYVFSLSVFCLGLMSEPMIVMFPLLLLLLDYWPLKQLSWNQVSSKAPFFVFSGAFATVAAYAQLSGKARTLCNISFRITSGDNVLVPYAGYLIKALWPSGLSVFYLPSASELPLGLALAHLFFGATVSGFVLYKAKTNPYLPVGWFWYVLSLVPVLGFIQGGEYAMADRYMYLPLIGLAILFVWGGSALLEKKRSLKILAMPAAVLTVFLLGFVALFQTAYWSKSETLFSRAVKITPDNPIAHTIMGRVLFFGGKLESAQVQFEQALALAPDDAAAHHGLAMIYTEKKDYNNAIIHLSKALNQELDFPKSYDHLGAFLEEKGRDDEALKQYEKSISLKPDYWEAHFHLALLLNKKGKKEDAIRGFREVLKINPKHLRAQEELDRLTSPHV